MTHRLGRPRKGHEKNRPCRLAFLTSEAGRAAVEAAAAAENKSISDVINDLIEKELLAKPRKRQRSEASGV